jgi:methylmalonyl-CoA mutase N-terminal domain/subunit
MIRGSMPPPTDDLPPLCTAADLQGLEDLPGLPGLPPFARGAEPVARGWPLALKLSVEDLRQGLDEPRGRYFELEAGFLSLPVLERFAECLRRTGVDPQSVAGAIAFDPLGAGVFEPEPEPWRQALAESAGALRFVSVALRGLRALQLDGSAFAAGAPPALELGLLVASGVEYLRAAPGLGLAVELLAAHTSMRLPVTTEVLHSIAKLRAARVVWAKVVHSFGVLHKHSQALHVQAVSGRHELAARDPHTNLVRTTLHATAAALGGCDAFTLDPFDVRAGGSSAGERLAVNQQLLLVHEAMLGRVQDAAGGSYAIEALTDRIGRGAWQVLQQVEKAGGFARALEGGLVRGLLDEATAHRKEAVATRRRPIVGTSVHVGPDDGPDCEPAGEVEAGFLSAPFDRLRAAARAVPSGPPTFRCEGSEGVELARDLLRAGGFVEAGDAAGAGIVVSCADRDGVPEVVAGGRRFRPGDDAVAFLRDLQRDLGLLEAGA